MSRFDGFPTISAPKTNLNKVETKPKDNIKIPTADKYQEELKSIRSRLQELLGAIPSIAKLYRSPAQKTSDLEQEFEELIKQKEVNQNTIEKYKLEYYRQEKGKAVQDDVQIKYDYALGLESKIFEINKKMAELQQRIDYNNKNTDPQPQIDFNNLLNQYEILKQTFVDLESNEQLTVSDQIQSLKDVTKKLNQIYYGMLKQTGINTISNNISLQKEARNNLEKLINEAKTFFELTGDSKLGMEIAALEINGGIIILNEKELTMATLNLESTLNQAKNKVFGVNNISNISRISIPKAQTLKS